MVDAKSMSVSVLGGESRHPTGDRAETYSHGWLDIKRWRSVGRDLVVMGGRGEDEMLESTEGETTVAAGCRCS